MNRLWGVDDEHPTVGAIARFLRGETERTGGLALFDLHAGTAWRGHHLIVRTDDGFPEFESMLRDEGLAYHVLNQRNTGGGIKRGFFNYFAQGLAGVRMSYIIEISMISDITPGGTEPTSVAALRRDGVALYRAIKRFAASLEPDPGGSGGSRPG